MELEDLKRDNWENIVSAVKGVNNMLKPDTVFIPVGSGEEMTPDKFMELMVTYEFNHVWRDGFRMMYNYNKTYYTRVREESKQLDSAIVDFERYATEVMQFAKEHKEFVQSARNMKRLHGDNYEEVIQNMTEEIIAMKGDLEAKNNALKDIKRQSELMAATAEQGLGADLMKAVTKQRKTDDTESSTESMERTYD